MTWSQTFSKSLGKLRRSIINYILFWILILKPFSILIYFVYLLHTCKTPWLMRKFPSKIFLVRNLQKLWISIKFIRRFASSWRIHSASIITIAVKSRTFFNLLSKRILEIWQVFRHRNIPFPFGFKIVKLDSISISSWMVSWYLLYWLNIAL